MAQLPCVTASRAATHDALAVAPAGEVGSQQMPSEAYAEVLTTVDIGDDVS